MILQIPTFKVRNLNLKSSDTVLIIPVINEGERIRSQIRSIFEFGASVDVIIADGGSTDGSLDSDDFFRKLGVMTILEKTGPGKLSAQLRMAYAFALESGFKYLVTMDGNGKDGIEGISVIQNALFEGYDFVQGSRYVKGGIAKNTPKLREFAIKYIHAPITSKFSGKKFTDTTNGFRGYSRNLLLSMDIQIFREVFSSYELIFYLPIRSCRVGMKVCEVPVRREYPQNGSVPTKISGIMAYIRLFTILLYAGLGRYDP